MPPSFEEGREVARSLDGIDSDGAYLEYVRGGTAPDDDGRSVGAMRAAAAVPILGVITRCGPGAGRGR